MRVLTSQLAGGRRNADRVLVTEIAVLVLDGASAFEPVPVDPGEYAETLAQAVARRLVLDPHVEISDAVAAGISTTARVFDLHPGQSPSSTIAILRGRDRVADLFVLGDSPTYFGTSTTSDVLRDDRLSTIAKPQRASSVDALRAGHGYSAAHRDSPTEL